MDITEKARQIVAEYMQLLVSNELAVVTSHFSEEVEKVFVLKTREKYKREMLKGRIRNDS